MPSASREDSSPPAPTSSTSTSSSSTSTSTTSSTSSSSSASEPPRRFRLLAKSGNSRRSSASSRFSIDLVPVIIEDCDEESDQLEERSAAKREAAPKETQPTEAEAEAEAASVAGEPRPPGEPLLPEETETEAAADDGDAEDAEDAEDAAVRCIFLCEFHATAGPRITAQVPAGYMTKEHFDTVSRYIIPKLQLQRSFLSVSLLGHKILGYPVRIDNQLYARNAFYFNVCFVFAPATRTVVYEPVVRKLTEYMLSMELATRLLSQASDPAHVARLCRLLAQIRTDLNRKRMCILQEGSSIIPLCIVPHRRPHPDIRPHAAAVLNDRFHQHRWDRWDLTTARIAPYVNGFHHVARISALADVAVALVLDCVRHLVMLGVASAVPVFQYSNVYRPTPKLAQLAKCRELQRRCLARCSKSDRCRATVRDIFRLFASMAHGATFGELCVRFNPAALNINDRALVLFGLIEGLIRRVDKYPVTVSRNQFSDAERQVAVVAGSGAATSSSTPSQRASRPLPRSFWQQQQQQQQLQQRQLQQQQQQQQQRSRQNGATLVTPTPLYYYNGLKSLDEICCARGISCQQLEQQLAHDRHVIVLLK